MKMKIFLLAAFLFWPAASSYCEVRSAFIPVRYELMCGKRFLCAQPAQLAQEPDGATLFVAGTCSCIESNNVTFGDVAPFSLEDGSLVYLAKPGSAWLKNHDEVAFLASTKLRAKYLHLDLSRNLVLMTAGVDEHSRDFAVRIVLEDQATMGEVNSELVKFDSSDLGRIVASGQVAPLYDEFNGCLVFTELSGKTHTFHLPAQIIKNSSRTLTPWHRLQRPVQIETAQSK